MDRGNPTSAAGMDMPIMHDSDRYDLVKDNRLGNFGIARLMSDKQTKELVAVKYIERGNKEASASISGADVYGKLKFESGIHRVQRVPVTEKSGRVHTSAVSVDILPQADKAFNGKRWEKFNSEKVASLAYARIQGKAALVTHFQISSLMNEDKRCRPILFYSEDSEAGEQVKTLML